MMNCHAFPAALLAALFFGCASPATDSTAESAAKSTAAEVPASPAGPQFYRVSGHGATGYLFGTVHLNDERTKSLPAAVGNAFESSDALFVEMAPGREAAMEMQRLALLPEGTTLDVIVGEETWKRIGDRYEKAGLPRAAADSSKALAPWVVLSQIGFLDMMDEEAVLDLSFAMRAKEEGKSVSGLESVSEQLSLFTDLTHDEQAQWLDDFLGTLDAYDAEGRSMGVETIDAWHSGDPAQLYGLLEQILCKMGPEEREAMERKLLWKRNESFAEQIDGALREAPNEVGFVAVGAMHLPNLPGLDVAAERVATQPRRLGVAELLRTRGYEVTRIDAETGLSAEELPRSPR